MRPILTLLAPDQQVYPRQRQTRGGIHRPDNGNPTHGMPSSGCDNAPVDCSASQEACVRPEMRYGSLRTTIVAIRCSLIHVSWTSTTLYGSVPARGGALFLTRYAR